MAYQLASAFVDVSVRSGGLIGAFGSIKTQINAMLSGFGNVSPLLGAVAGIGSLTYAVYQFMGAAEQAFDAETRLESTIRASGNAARIAKEEVLDMSAALQQKGIFGNTEITAATTKLLQMRAITRQSFPEIIKLSTDVAAAGFGSVEHAANSLGRALADPARGLFRLRAIGIIFTKSEQEKIQKLAKSNNLFGAQQAILEKVRNAYGGFNEAMAKTPAGEWKKIKNDLSDISETLGKKIYPIAVDIGRAVLQITKPVALLVGWALDINMALGNWPIKITLAATAAYGLARAIGTVQAAVIASRVDMIAMFTSLRRFVVGGQLQQVSMGFVRVPGLLSRINSSAARTGATITRWFGDASRVVNTMGVHIYNFVLPALESMEPAIRRLFPALATLLFTYVEPVSMGFVRMPGLIERVGASLNRLQTVSMASWFANPITAVIGVIVGLLAIIATEIYLIYRWVSATPKLVDAVASAWDAVAIIAEELWNSLYRIGELIFYIGLDIVNTFAPWIAELPIIKQFIEEGIVGAVEYMIKMLTEALTFLGAVIKTISTMMEDIMFNIRAITSGDFNFAKMSNPAEVFGEEYLRIQAEIKKRAADRKDKKAVRPGANNNSSISTLDVGSGLSGLQDAWKNVQEALLKKESPMERAANGIESLDDTADRMLTELAGINGKLSTNGPVVAGV